MRVKAAAFAGFLLGLVVIDGIFYQVRYDGYHLYFLSADRRRGGHLLDCRLEKGRLEAAPLERFIMLLPTGRDFLSKDLAPTARYDPRVGFAPLPDEKE